MPLLSPQQLQQVLQVSLAVCELVAVHIPQHTQGGSEEASHMTRSSYLSILGTCTRCTCSQAAGSAKQCTVRDGKLASGSKAA